MALNTPANAAPISTPATATPTSMHRPVSAGLALAAALTLAACESNPHSAMSFEAVGTDNYAARHPIVTAPRAVGLEVGVAVDAVTLTAEQSAQLHAYGRDYAANGHGPIEVLVPTDSPNAAAASHVVAHVQRVLHAAGASHVSVRPVASGWHVPAPIALSYYASGARVERCGRWPAESGLTSRPDNTSYFNYGCSAQRNLAAMIADPRDLSEPRAVTTASANRRYRQLVAHGVGRPTASLYETSREDAATSDE